MWQLTPYTLPLFTAAGVLTALALYIRRERSIYARIPGARIACALLVASALWMFAYGFELTSTGLAAKVLWNKVQYLGSTLVPPLWFAYVLVYTNNGRHLTRRTFTALAVVPLLTQVLVFTNELHGLIWSRVSLDATTASFTVLVNEHGAAYWLFIVYAYALVLGSFGLLSFNAIKSQGFYRRQNAALLFGALAPAVGGILYNAGINPFPHLNLPVVAFVLTSLVVAWSVFRHHLFRIIPVARETVLEEMDEAVIVVDDHDRVVDLNVSARRLLDYPEPVAVGCPADEVFAAYPNLFERLRAVNDTHAEIRTEVPVDDARFNLRISPLTGRHGTPTGRLVVLHDITDQKRREEQLRRQNERLDEFANVVSHDLRNPLNVARGRLDVLAETGDLDHVEAIDRAHDRMARIIDDVLLLAREGQAPDQMQTVDVAEVARHAWENVETADATLRVDGERTVDADADRLQRVFENLFRNSMEHGSTSSRNESGDVGERGSPSNRTMSDDAVERAGSGIVVRVEIDDGGFAVADSGPGIPADAQETVFEHGYSTSETGTGFGLSIVRTIVRSHDWSISLAEDHDGGARFEISTE